MVGYKINEETDYKYIYQKFRFLENDPIILENDFKCLLLNCLKSTFFFFLKRLFICLDINKNKERDYLRANSNGYFFKKILKLLN